MPSAFHEPLVGLVGNRPELAPELLVDVLGITVPPLTAVRVEDAEFSDVTPSVYRSDKVVVLSEAEENVYAVVVEVQLGRDQDKRWSWPVYLATLRAELRCPAVLLVICVDEAMARWSATPIDMGHPGWVLHPFVIGPTVVPVVDTAAAARASPELSVFSALAHGADPDRHDVLEALVTGLSTFERHRFDPVR